MAIQARASAPRITQARAFLATDFRENAVASGLPSGWTSAWVTGGTQNVASSSSSLSGKVLETSQPTNARRAFVLDKAGGNNGDCELLALMRFTGALAASAASLVVRVAGSSGAETGYACRLPGGSVITMDFVRYSGGSATAHGAVSHGVSLSVGVLFYIRFRVIGGNLFGKIWLANTSEPASWTTTHTDGSPLSAGGVGILHFGGDASTVMQHLWFSVARGGGRAPMPWG